MSAARGLFAGIDSGSWTTKAVVIDAEARVLGKAVVRSAADLPRAAEEAFALALGQARLAPEDLDSIWATGFGRDALSLASGTRTELDCHARGVRQYVPGALTIIDIGGQDAKVIKLDENGRRVSHKMNRKCAAGTGSFLDEMALRLAVPTAGLNELASRFQEEIELGSFCTVFSGTELLAAIRQGKRPSDLARAAYKSVVKRVLEMEVFEGKVVATGGVIAHHPMVVDLLGALLGREVIVPPHPQEMGAFGAALVAREAAHPAPAGKALSLAASTIRDGNTLSSALRPVGERETMAGLLKRNALRFGERAAYRERKDGGWEDRSWRRLEDEAVSLALCLRSHGIGRGDRVGVLSRNRGEMLVTEFAVMSLGAIYVPIFAGYSAEQTLILLRHARPSALILAGPEQCTKAALETAGDKGFESLRLVVTFDEVPADLVKRALPGFRGAALLLDEALAEGRRGSTGDRGTTGDPEVASGRLGLTGKFLDDFYRSCAAVEPTDPCLMMYTSGTGGELKGVLLTHDNILSQQRALAAIWSLGPEDRFLSYLPWHHSFGGIFEKYNALYNGALLVLDDGLGKDFPRLLENWKAARPTVYFSVPVIYQQLVDHVRLHPEDERLIFPDGMKFVFTAAAPLPAGISAYFAERKIPVAEGWGLTETSPCCTVTDLREGRSVPGMVGYPIPGVKVRLEEDGEILVQGPNVMLGYYENLEETRRVLPGDGWFRTGDLGELTGKGLRLIARKDRIFKLLNGERVIPTPLENKLAGSSPYIRHVVIAGTAREHLTALIFPNLPLIEEEFGGDREKADRVVKDSFVRAIRELNESHPVRYERIQAFAVVSRILSVENGELTPSMKVRVANVLGNCGEYVEAVYQPTRDCDCRFLRKVVRLRPDPRFCFRGNELTLDRCHECGLFVFPDADDQPGEGQARENRRTESRFKEDQPKEHPTKEERSREGWR